MSNKEPGPVLRGRTDECAYLGELLAQVRAGNSRVLVLSGEAGVGKTALLDYLAAQASDCRLTRWVGVESEMELPFAGLRQICEPLLGDLDRLAPPQRDAVAVALGLEAGKPADRFLIGLAVLNLLAGAAEDTPVVWIVDDAQWLDRISEQVLGFVARRLLAERVGIVFALRGSVVEGEFVRMPQLPIDGVDDDEARQILASVVRQPIDTRVRDRIIAEAHGNPLALLELPHALTDAEWGGYGRHGMPLTSRIEREFLSRLESLETEVRRFLLVAAAEPLGDIALLWRAADQLGLDRRTGVAAEATGLIELGTRVRFRHPLVRSAAYRSMPTDERVAVHRALAAVTDRQLDPDRRAWHRRRAAAGPDEDVAAELEAAADRARMRGGLTAAATFLEHAAVLTPDAGRRADRALAAAWAKCDAGSLDEALTLLGTVDAGPADPMRAAQADHLRGQVAFDRAHGAEAARYLLSAARQLLPLDEKVARDTHLEALSAAMWASNPAYPESFAAVTDTARACPRSYEPTRATEWLLDGLSRRFTDGYAAAAPTLARALEAALTAEVGADDVGRLLWMVGNRVSGIIAVELWDFDAGYELATRQVRLARDAGALLQLQFALNFLANYEELAGNLDEAALLLEEDRLVGDASGNPRVGYSAMTLAGLRGQEALATELIAAASSAEATRERGRIVTFGSYARAVLYNGLVRYDTALDAAREVFDYEILGYRTLVVGELAEAALHGDDLPRVQHAAEWLSERVQATPTAWARAMDARVRAMLSTGDEADSLHRQSIADFARTRLRPELARGHLLHGEWLRREGQRIEARTALQTAHDMLAAMGMDGFAERARRELIATGATARRRSVETTLELTAQEAQIARLAREGYSNPEIGSRLFLSPRTVEWHMSRVFTKLGVRSRRQLRDLTVSPAMLAAGGAPAAV
jgi:DNA-binding CsgD family transcriptional regulator